MKPHGQWQQNASGGHDEPEEDIVQTNSRMQFWLRGNRFEGAHSIPIIVCDTRYTWASHTFMLTDRIHVKIAGIHVKNIVVLV